MSYHSFTVPDDRHPSDKTVISPIADILRNRDCAGTALEPWKEVICSFTGKPEMHYRVIGCICRSKTHE